MNRFNIRTLHDLSSDHTPLLADLQAMPLKKPLRSRFLAPGTHVDTFKDHLSEQIDLNMEIQGTEVDLLRLKQNVRKEFARTGDVRIQQIYRLSNRLHKVLTQRKQQQIDNLLENLGTDASSQFSLWRITKRFKFQPIWWLVPHITG
ncbi:GD11939 [Drosophila simulans]|uniref:GD11939 n=1 Tax=Drosophila simulans TaxID=7240 RepID=B4NTI7_DROSI|nr:GD11939 [Drosophila simulans]